jgi:hypothetical protein
MARAGGIALGVLGVAAVAALALAVWLAPSRTIVTQVDIAASPGRVWAVLTDTATYPAWNPHTRLTGTLQPGNIILHEEHNAKITLSFHPVILAARAPEELRWQGNILTPALFAANHYFLLLAAPGGTHFTQGETLSGLAMWFFDIERMRPGFDEVNQALKTRVETLR